ncbi:hypothetical protein ACFCZT_23715, partial [Streptomyces sp. NPDC056230]|uniref:hypothetical protein n=1 Tax=Streptomyces sp. NPDC056230 TaxID=3345754 RepID=UPI0035E315A6
PEGEQAAEGREKPEGEQAGLRQPMDTRFHTTRFRGWSGPGALLTQVPTAWWHPKPEFRRHAYRHP